MALDLRRSPNPTASVRGPGATVLGVGVSYHRRFVCEIWFIFPIRQFHKLPGGAGGVSYTLCVAHISEIFYPFIFNS